MTDNLEPLRNIEGFPLGKDEDLHALSNPPYYTAYPNPHIADFIKHYGKPYDEATDDYHREPFVTDVSEGKNDPIYNAHGYHTKVPYKAIIPFVEHYTLPGEIVFDGFCGTGMTGIAAQISGRRAILCDLSPAATFISHNYNHTISAEKYETEMNRILQKVESECAWMYETKHSNGHIGRINYVIWSDVFLCSYCGSEVIFWDAAVDTYEGKVLDEFNCPTCKAEMKKRGSQRATELFFDSAIGKNVEQNKRVPVLINYEADDRRHDKKPDSSDLELIKKIKLINIPYWFPTDRMPDGGESRRNDDAGITHVHHFFTKRNLWAFAACWNGFSENDHSSKHLLWTLTGILQRATIMHQLAITRMSTSKPIEGGKTAGHRRGTLYVPSLQVEFSTLALLKTRIREITKSLIASRDWTKSSILVSTQSSTRLENIPKESIDYIYTDPPFGENIMYSELNFLWESWLRVQTNNKDEAIINKSQRKSLDEYRNLMTACFSEDYRILKSGKWITVVFHNSKAKVWNAIQESLAHAGFIVAQVTVLDKVKKTHTQVTAAGAVQNDLVINAYKPRAGFTQRLISHAGRGLELDFVREHLRQLPIAVNVERSKEMLYSKYLAYYVQHGYQVMYNGEQFYRALAQWGLDERDGYWFADEAQAHEYEKRKIKTFGNKDITPQAVLFISDERSARQWVWNFLDEPKTYDEIYTKFMPAQQTSEDEIPELRTLLEESFVMSGGEWKRPDQLTQTELEHKRMERLLRQFNEYLAAAQTGQKLKEVRREAVLAGFTECYRAGKFQDIITLGKKLDKRLLEESPELFDFVDIAEAKIG